MTRADCDIREPSALRTAIHNADPDLILNAAAYTAVDQAETDIEQCFAINSLAPRIMAEEAAASGALLVHYSTDYVFDGRKDAPYTESDAVNPQNQYGLSKLEGERAIQASGAKYLIFRTSWVFSPHGHNFLLTMLRLGKERTCLKIVDDQVGSPTSATDIARATIRVLGEPSSHEGLPAGLYHMTSEGYVSWCGFAREIFQQANFDNVSVEPIKTEAYPTAAARPKNSRLSNNHFAARFGFRLRPWSEQLEETLSALLTHRSMSETGGRP